TASVPSPASVVVDANRPPIGSGGSTASVPSPAYARGVAAWDALRAWVDTQSDDRRAGVDYWSANRSDPDHFSCAEEAKTYCGDQRLFAAGCQDAKRKLDPIDDARH